MHIPPALQMVGWAAIAWGIDRLVPSLDFYLHQQDMLAVSLFLIGLGLGVTGIIQFLRASTTVNPVNPAEAKTIVSSGIYSISRNPMYLGMLIILLSWVIAVGNLVSFVTLPGFVAVITITQIKPEEKILTEKFGEDYIDYMKRVRRWI